MDLSIAILTNQRVLVLKLSLYVTILSFEHHMHHPAERHRPTIPSVTSVNSNVNSRGLLAVVRGHREVPRKVMSLLIPLFNYRCTINLQLILVHQLIALLVAPHFLNICSMAISGI